MTMVIPEASTEELILLGESLRSYAAADRILQIVPQLRSWATEAMLSRLQVETLISVPNEESGKAVGRRWTQAIPRAQMVVVRGRSGIILPAARRSRISPARSSSSRAGRSTSGERTRRRGRGRCCSRT